MNGEGLRSGKGEMFDYDEDQDRCKCGGKFRFTSYDNFVGSVWNCEDCDEEVTELPD